MQFSRLAINFAFLVNGFLYANWVARLPKYQSIYNMDNSATGLVLLSMASRALIAMPFTGWLIMKYGSKAVTSCASICLCLVLPFTPLLSTVWALGALFFILGIFNGIMDVAMNAQAVLLETAYKKPIMSSFHAVFSGGMMLGAGVAALLTKSNITLFYHILFVTLCSFLLVLWSIRYYVKETITKNEEATKAFQLPSKALLGIGIIAFCCMLGEGAIADWSTNYMLNIAGSSDSLSPIALGAFSLAMMVGRIFGDSSRVKFGDGRLLIVNSLIASTGLFILVLFPFPIAVIFACLLIGLGLSVIVPIAYSTAGLLKNIPTGVGISMVTTIGYTGFLFGPPIIGFLADWYSLQIAMLLVGILFAIMTVLSFMHSTENV